MLLVCFRQPEQLKYLRNLLFIVSITNIINFISMFEKIPQSTVKLLSVLHVKLKA